MRMTVDRNLVPSSMRKAVVRTAALSLVLGLMLSGESEAQPQFTAPYLKNFNQPHYLVPVREVDGSVLGGDLNTTYYEINTFLAPNKELLIVGEFPRSRYFSVVLYDDHGAIIGSMDDADIEPLVPGQENPFRPGGPHGQEDALYALTVRLDDAPLATNPLDICSFGIADVHVNVLDGRSRHTAHSFYSCEQSGFSASVPNFGEVVHDDSPDNGAISIYLRQILSKGEAPDSNFDLTKPLVWLRESSSGCPIQMAPVGESPDPNDWYHPIRVVNILQIAAHGFHELELGFTTPYGIDPGHPVGNPPVQIPNGIVWTGAQEYLLKQLPYRYVTGVVPANLYLPHPNLAAWLNDEDRVMVMAVRMPTVPCAGFPDCPLVGDEELRYYGLSLVENATRTTFATLSDEDIVTDANGYAQIVVSFGTPLPAHVNAANGYTVLELDPSNFDRVDIRNLVPSATFGCSTANVPFRTAEHHPNGGYMGEYVPYVGYPPAANLPPTADPIVQVGSCTPPVPPPDPCA